MESIEKIILGLLLFATTSVIAYLFKMRQLYASTPKLYRHAPISKDGSLSEIIIFNKGNQVEENIILEIDPALSFELLATSAADVAIEGATIKIERLHKGCDVSIVLLVENGLLDSSKVTAVSSKGTKGRVCAKLSDVPPNFALTFIAFILILGFLPGMIYGEKIYSRAKDEYVEYKFQEQIKAGWSNLTRYYDSDLRGSYSDNEFPVRLIETKALESEETLAVFEAYNKSATSLDIGAKLSGSEDGDVSHYGHAEVPPMSSKQIEIKVPTLEQEGELTKINFSFIMGRDVSYGIVYNLKQAKKSVPKQEAAKPKINIAR
jgi:hypothetical protein